MTNSRYRNSSDGLTGEPSDRVPAILATGDSGVNTMFLSMSERHPEGADADYLRWHSLDHRPEQMRLRGIRNSLRVVSTPECRRARAACDESFEAVDHVMTYFFGGQEGLVEFVTLSDALRDAGRSPFILPPVQRGVYDVDNRIAAPRMKTGADVLPWMPVRGVYILIEDRAADTAGLVDAPGVAGVWTGKSKPTSSSSADAGQHLSYCFLDCDPVETAGELQPILERRWRENGITPLFAAPFHCIVPYEWDRYLP